ncbi:hypothetical protein [Ferdinandcohnia sp. Marseille-Q9671]
MVLLLLFTLILVGCTNQVSINTSKSVANETDYLNDYAANPQVPDDRTLLEAGQSILDEKGEITLKRIKQVNETYEIGPIKITIRDMKLIHLRPDYSLIDYFHVLTHKEEFDFVKVFVEIENTSSEEVNFAPVALLNSNTGETFDWEKDIYLEDLNGVIEGNSSKKGNLGFILKSSDNLESIEITTSDVFDQDEKKITNAQKVTLEF